MEEIEEKIQQMIEQETDDRFNTMCDQIYKFFGTLAARYFSVTVRSSGQCEVQMERMASGDEAACRWVTDRLREEAKKKVMRKLFHGDE